MTSGPSFYASSRESMRAMYSTATVYTNVISNDILLLTGTTRDDYSKFEQFGPLTDVKVKYKIRVPSRISAVLELPKFNKFLGPYYHVSNFSCSARSLARRLPNAYTNNPIICGSNPIICREYTQRVWTKLLPKMAFE